MDTQRLAAFAVMVALAGSAGAATAATPTSAPATQDVDQAMSKLAAKVIGDASDARAALVANKNDAASTDIDDALTARDSLAAKARSAGLPMIVPVYAELDDTAVLSAATKQSAKSQSPAPQTVRANAADITYVAIDLDKAKAHLDAARASIADHNTVAARDSLAAVGNDLVEVSVATDLPLLTAREDLARAQREMNANDRAAATADLHQAAKSLRAYTKGQYVTGAQQLANEIDANAALSGGTTMTASEKIAAWWSSVKGWFAQHA